MQRVACSRKYAATHYGRKRNGHLPLIIVAHAHGCIISAAIRVLRTGRNIASPLGIIRHTDRWA